MEKYQQDRVFTFSALDPESGLRLTLNVEFSTAGTRLTGRYLGSEMPRWLAQALETGLASLYRESAEVLTSVEESIRS